MHVMAGLDDNGNFQDPVGYEEMYQGLANPENKVSSDLAWIPLTSTGTNYVAVAICELEDGVDAEFQMHDTPRHSNRYIIEGVAAPEVGINVRVLGARTGEVTATIREVNMPLEDFKGRSFGGVMEMSCSRMLESGNSGAPVLYEVKEGVYRMVGIAFYNNYLRPLAWAIPASAAEEALGITFGERVTLESLGLNEQSSFDESDYGRWQTLTDLSGDALDLLTVDTSDEGDNRAAAQFALWHSAL